MADPLGKKAILRTELARFAPSPRAIKQLEQVTEIPVILERLAAAEAKIIDLQAQIDALPP